MDRQKLLTIFGLAWVSAALLTWFLYAKTTAPKQEKMARIVAAARDLGIGSRVSKEDLKMVTMLERDVPRSALTQPSQAIGRALVYPVGASEPLTASRLATLTGPEGAAAVIEPGKRAISVPFTDSTGASGLIQPRSRVDVLFTRTGSVAEAMTVTVLEDIEVLSVGRTTQVESASGSATGTSAKAVTTVSSTATRTATLIVTPEQAQKLELAKNQGKLSLALRNPADRSVQADPYPATMAGLDPMFVSRSGRAGRLGGNVKDAKAWAKLIGEEEPKPPEVKKEPPPPPKPKIIVDVYRGDKHVQEIFQ